MDKFNNKIAGISILKTFISTTLAPFVGARIVLNMEWLESFLLAGISGLIMAGVTFVNILNRYQKYLEQENESK